jgi:uncharacterized protein (DUF1800 family)
LKGLSGGAVALKAILPKEVKTMSHPSFYTKTPASRQVASTLVLLLGWLLILEPICVLSVSAQGLRMHRDASSKRHELTDERRAVHVLARLGFGARPGDFERVKAMGVDAYIEQQLNPDAIDDTVLVGRLAKLPTLALATPTLVEQYNPPKPALSPSSTPKPVIPAPEQPLQTVASANAIASAIQNTEKIEAQKSIQTQKPATDEMQKTALVTLGKQVPAKPQTPAHNPQQVVTELQRATLLRAIYSERQLYELMVEFWENHFNIYSQKDADRWLLTGFDRDAIRPFALSRFRDLLGATAHSPAMLFYLDNWQSSVQRKYPAANGKPARIAGGINENYARELMELHTLGVDGGYTQRDVQEVARCFTGWTIRKPNEEGLFVFNPAAHDNGEKIVLGQKIPAGGGLSDGEHVLDILARNPSTARFIATKLARRFIDDDPPASVINRAAAVFLKTDGNIRETLRAIITAPEFFSSKAYRAKVRSPLEYAAAALRVSNAETDGDRPMLDWIARMGQPLFGRITPDGFPDHAKQWLSTGALIERFNFASALVTNKIKGTHIYVSRLLVGIDINNTRAGADRLTQLIFDGDLTQATRAVLVRAIATAAPNIKQQDGPAPTRLPAGYSPNTMKAKSEPAVPSYLGELLILILGAPEFQRR